MTAGENMTTTEPRDLMVLLGRLEQEPKGDGPEQQRRFRRFSIRADGLLEPLDPHCVEDTHTIMMRDVSRGGVGFLISHFIEPGTLWRVRFQTRTQVVGSQPIIARYCRLVQQDLYLVGGQFVIEPHVLIMLGVTEAELKQPEPDHTRVQDTEQFVTPESLTG